MTAHAHGRTHGHLWLVGALGLGAGLLLMVFVPSLAPVSHSLLLFAGFHLVGGVVVALSAWLMAERRLPARWRPGRDGFDFGWAAAWVWGPTLAALVALAGAVAVQVAWSQGWPLAMALTLVAASFFAGSLLTRDSARHRGALLPMVDLLPGGEGLVLDAGCGAGRMTIALARGYGRARVVAVDRFDAEYIRDGGRALLDANLERAGLSGRVEARRGDLLALPFGDGLFDAAVSAHALDHLGKDAGQGLREVRRVLKPGGRFLLVVWVPGWAMVAISSLAAFLLAPRSAWRRQAAEAGFVLLDQGTHNGHFFLLLERQ